MDKLLLRYVIILTSLGFSGAVSASGDTYKGVKPPNQPDNRHAGSPKVPNAGTEMPGMVKNGSKFKKLGKVTGLSKEFNATFNPAAWVMRDPSDGVLKVFMVYRGEKEVQVDFGDGQPPRLVKRSFPILAESRDGVHFTDHSKPLFVPDAWYDKMGGIEDPRYADLRLQPYIDPVDGKIFDGAVFYTAYDGTTARVAVSFFNHDNLNEFRKKGPIFPDADVIKNPLVPESPAWNKSPAMIQYKDTETGKIRNVLFVGEGNQHHGGIMAMESDRPFEWKWPAHQAPSILARPGMYDQNLVESAFQPMIAPLSEELQKKTGETHGIYLAVHGDSPPKGYQVGFKIFSLKNPTGKPIYESRGVFLSPELKWEIEGQVGKVVFASGAVVFHDQVFVYYGAGDTFIGVASAPAADGVNPVQWTQKAIGDPSLNESLNAFCIGNLHRKTQR